MKYIVVISFFCFLFSCEHRKNMTARVEFMIDSLITSGSLTGNVVSVFKEDKGDYNLYIFNNTVGLVYDTAGNNIVSEVRYYHGRAILFYFPMGDSINIDQSKLEKLIKDDNDSHHEQLWYYAVCKEGKKELIIQAKNADIASYEIPAIRDFSCSIPSEISSNEVIIYSVTAAKDDSLGITNIYMLANVYNRTSDTLHNQLKSETFAFIESEDTILCNLRRLPLRNTFIDDTLWVDNPELVLRYELNLSIKNKKELQFNRENMRQILTNSFCLINTVDSCKEVDVKILFPDKIAFHLEQNGKWIE